jgi:hypothetical protein
MLRANPGKRNDQDSEATQIAKSSSSPDAQKKEVPPEELPGEDVPVEEQGISESSDEDDPREMRMKNLDSGVEYNVRKVRLQ